MSKFVFNVANVIFKFGSIKRKTHKVLKNNAPFKTLKNICFGIKKLKTNKNCNSYGLMKI